jgi:hypothetical protein
MGSDWAVAKTIIRRRDAAIQDVDYPGRGAGVGELGAVAYMRRYDDGTTVTFISDGANALFVKVKEKPEDILLQDTFSSR